MILNISSGGISYLVVNAPDGAVITASCMGLVLNGTGTCIFEAPIIGTWYLTCMFDELELHHSIDVVTYGASYSIVFDYVAWIHVHTFPGAAVTASKSGFANLTGTADSTGNCILAIPPGGRGKWSVSADNGVVGELGADNVDVLEYGMHYSVSVLDRVPSITVVVGSNTYTYKGVEIDNSDVKITPVGVTGWKFWMKVSGTVTFNYLPTPVDICCIGKGGNGGSGWGGSGYYGGGGGGGGGEVKRLLHTGSVKAGVAYSVKVDGTGSALGDIISAQNGGNGGSPSAGVSGGGSGNGSSGEWINDHSYPASSGGGGNGGGGVFAFDNTDVFDGVRYANGGGGGGHSSYSGGVRYNTPGSGGGGGGGTGNHGRTNGLIGILIMRNAV